MLVGTLSLTKADRLSLAMLSWVSRFPAVPHWECPIVTGPRKILLSDTTSTLSIEKSGTPVRGLRSEARPFVIGPELANPIFFPDRFLPMFHLASK
jgi:hypothetical protein